MHHMSAKEPCPTNRIIRKADLRLETSGDIVRVLVLVVAGLGD